MPDILKQVQRPSAQQSAVRIPDISFAPPQAQEPLAPEPPAAPDAAAPLPEEPPVEPEKPELTREQLLALYAPEWEALRTEEALRAYADARAKKAGELKQCVLEVEQRMQELEAQQQAYMDSYAKDLKYLAVEIAEKFVNEKLDKDDLYLERLVLNTVAKVKNANWMTVELSDRMVELIERLKTELREADYHAAAEVSPISAPKDTVRVTTDTGTIDATVSVQANNLRELFGSMDSRS